LMKITGGKSRGRLLSSLKGMDIRPTSSRAREAIFNILGQDMTGIKVLDLFAGTGLLGIEAMSRGAEEAIFVDRSNQSIMIIKKNLILCGYEHLCQIIKRDIIKEPSIQSLPIKGRVDLVFVDPPYGKDINPPLLKKLSSSGILSEKAIVVAESSKNDRMPESAESLLLADSRIYGDTKIDIYRKEH
jgi:16S rRNA (guanine966-N2)-methyltransferase